MKINSITLMLAFATGFAFLIFAGMSPTGAGPCPNTLDGDTIGDCIDNCTTVDNQLQIDTNSDGYGNYCDADVDNDGVVGSSDLGLLKKSFLVTVPPGNPDLDFDSDGVIGASDLGILKRSFLGPPGPSACC